MKGTERDKIEKLCRYIARPAIALDRLSMSPNGQVVYTLKRPYDDGTTAISMTSLELLERLAAIVPRPKVHLTRFAGVIAPHYKYRSLVVLKPPTMPELQEVTADKAKPTKSRITWARLLRRVFSIDIETCERCGGKTKIIAAIEDPKVIKKILDHLDLPSKPPMIWPARGPPSIAEDDFQQFHEFDIT